VSNSASLPVLFPIAFKLSVSDTQEYTPILFSPVIPPITLFEAFARLSKDTFEEHPAM
jgi:hypothetical protein